MAPVSSVAKDAEAINSIRLARAEVTQASEKLARCAIEMKTPNELRDLIALAKCVDLQNQQARGATERPHRPKEALAKYNCEDASLGGTRILFRADTPRVRLFSIGMFRGRRILAIRNASPFP